MTILLRQELCKGKCEQLYSQTQILPVIVTQLSIPHNTTNKSITQTKNRLFNATIFVAKNSKKSAVSVIATLCKMQSAGAFSRASPNLDAVHSHTHTQHAYTHTPDAVTYVCSNTWPLGPCITFNNYCICERSK